MRMIVCVNLLALIGCFSPIPGRGKPHSLDGGLPRDSGTVVVNWMVEIETTFTRHQLAPSEAARNDIGLHYQDADVFVESGELECGANGCPADFGHDAFWTGLDFYSGTRVYMTKLIQLSHDTVAPDFMVYDTYQFDCSVSDPESDYCLRHSPTTITNHVRFYDEHGNVGEEHIYCVKYQEASMMPKQVVELVHNDDGFQIFQIGYEATEIPLDGECQ